jgi:hypothetical protein
VYNSRFVLYRCLWRSMSYNLFIVSLCVCVCVVRNSQRLTRSTHFPDLPTGS